MDFAQRNFANNLADSKTVAVRHSDIAENYSVAPDLDIVDFAQQEIAHFEQNRSKNQSWFGFILLMIISQKSFFRKEKPRFLRSYIFTKKFR